MLAAAAVGGGALLARPPVADAYPACPWRSLTGLDCPFCGGLRSVAALLHGHLGEAADLNLLVATAVPAGMIAAVLLVVLGDRARRPMAAALSGRGLSLALAVAVAFFILRMLPFGHWLTTTA